MLTDTDVLIYKIVHRHVPLWITIHSECWTAFAFFNFFSFIWRVSETHSIKINPQWQHEFDYKKHGGKELKKGTVCLVDSVWTLMMLNSCWGVACNRAASCVISCRLELKEILFYVTNVAHWKILILKLQSVDYYLTCATNRWKVYLTMNSYLFQNDIGRNIMCPVLSLINFWE